MRRQKYIEGKKNRGIQPKSKFLILFSLIAIITVSLLVFTLVKISTLDKYSFVARDTKNNETFVYVVDASNDQIKKYLIKSDLILNSSYSLGEYSLNNLWILSEKEKIGGKLVSKSIVKNFNLPVYYYLNGNETNMDIFHLIKSKLVVSKNINLDGEIKNSNLQKSILVDFVDQEIQDSGLGVSIVDLTGSYDISENISVTIDTLGSKIVDFSRGVDENLDCEISGDTQNKLTSKLALIYECNIVSNRENSEGVEFRIGKKFAEKY